MTELHFDKEIPTLENMKLLHCKKLQSLSGLDKLHGLNQLKIWKTDIDFNEFIKQQFPKSLDIFAFYTSKTKMDKEIHDRLLKLGYRDNLNNESRP